MLGLSWQTPTCCGWCRAAAWPRNAFMVGGEPPPPELDGVLRGTLPIRGAVLPDLRDRLEISKVLGGWAGLRSAVRPSKPVSRRVVISERIASCPYNRKACRPDTQALNPCRAGHAVRTSNATVSPRQTTLQAGMSAQTITVCNPAFDLPRNLYQNHKSTPCRWICLA